MTGRVWWMALALVLCALSPARAGAEGAAAVAPPPADTVRASIQHGVDWLLAQEFRRTDVILFGVWISDEIAPTLPDAAARLRGKSLARYQERWPDELYLRKLLGGKQTLPKDSAAFDRHRDKIRARLAEGTLGQSGAGNQDFLLVSLYANDPAVKGTSIRSSRRSSRGRSAATA